MRVSDEEMMAGVRMALAGLRRRNSPTLLNRYALDLVDARAVLNMLIIWDNYGGDAPEMLKDTVKAARKAMKSGWSRRNGKEPI